MVETDIRKRKGLEEFVLLLVEEEGIKTAKSRKPSSQTVTDQWRNDRSVLIIVYALVCVSKRILYTQNNNIVCIGTILHRWMVKTQRV